MTKGQLKKAKTNTGQVVEVQDSTTDYKVDLWRMTDALRGLMDVAEYKYVVLGLIFLKYISDAFEERHTQLEAKAGQGTNPEGLGRYQTQNIFLVPPEACWAQLKVRVRQPTIGQNINTAMDSIERDNPVLKGVLPKDYDHPDVDKQRLGQIIDLVSNIQAGDADSHSKNVFGEVYEYFLSQFARKQGKKGSEFYTPRCVVRLLVEMLQPHKGRVYDPCCGSCGMLVQSVAFSDAHAAGNGNGEKARGDILIYGQESNYRIWQIAQMNLIIRGIEGQIEHGDSFHNDCHPHLKADFILAHPHFNDKDWGGERLADDKRWQYGKPPGCNANFAWVQHIVHHLAPKGTAVFVLANGSMSSAHSGESEIRRNLIEAGLVDCMVALPGQLFYTTQIPACLWFLSRNRSNEEIKDRREYILFIDARALGGMVERTRRELTNEDIARIADTYHFWRTGGSGYADIPGFCRSVPLDEVRRHDHVLTPGSYVVTAPQENNGETFDDKMKQLVSQLREQQAEGAQLDEVIAHNFETLGFWSEEDHAQR